MQKEIKESSSAQFSVKLKVKGYADLLKLRLSALVVVSAILGYFIAPGEADLTAVVYLFLGGFLVTGASNALNQVWERDLDKLMSRTQNRPIPTGVLSVKESLFFAVCCFLIGIFLLWKINFSCAVLGAFALGSYVFVYTPLKTVSPIAVLVGAFPGSIPPMLGYVAASGTFGLEPGILFFIQFFWQFPHFWSIAWSLDDDYKKAGFKMLPSGFRDKRSAFQIMLYTAFLIPVSMLPWVVEISGVFSMFLAIIFGILILIPAVRLHQSLKMKYAKQVMFYSFAYLPLLLLIFFLDKV